MTTVLNRDNAHVADVPKGTEVRRALWRVYLPVLHRYVSDEAGRLVARSLVRESDGWSVTEPDALNTAEVVKALFLLDACHVSHGLCPRQLIDTLVERHLAEADYQVTALALWGAAIGRSRHAGNLFNRLRAAVTPA